MITFYRNLGLGALLLMLLTALMFYIAHQKAQLVLPLFPEPDEMLLWKMALEPEQPKGKSSTAFTCTQRWSDVTLTLEGLETPLYFLSLSA